MARSRPLAIAEQLHRSQPNGYRDIAAVMFAWVRDGRYQPGRQIPTEAELCSAFKVSRVTIRRALAVLIAAGALESRQGMGTFVSANYKAAPPNINVKLLGPHLGIWLEGDVFQFLGSKTKVPISAEQKFFGDDVKVVEEFRYVRKRHGVPVDYATFTYADWVTELIEDRTEAVMLHLNPYLAERGVELRSSQHAVGAIIADKTLATILDVDVGAPIVRVRITWWDQQQRPYMRGVWHHRADRYELNLELTLEHGLPKSDTTQKSGLKLRSV